MAEIPLSLERDSFVGDFFAMRNGMKTELARMRNPAGIKPPGKEGFIWPFHFVPHHFQVGNAVVT